MENNSIDNAERTGKGVKFERLRRIKVYLVGKVDRWNDTKKSELNDMQQSKYNEYGQRPWGEISRALF